MKTLAKVILPVTAMAFMAACASNWDIDGTKAMKGGTEFADALKMEYANLADAERAEDDWSDSAYFNNKGRAAASGADVQPQMIPERGLPDDKVGELTTARVDLMSALPAGKTSAPAAAARAQAMFDCWMQEQEENFQPEDIAACRDGFYAAMKDLEPKPMPMAEPAPMAQPKTFIVYFGFNKANVDTTGMSIVDKIVSYFKEINAASVDISGHTDTMGPSSYNNMLAQKRADNVAAALNGKVKGGVIINAYGESKLAVQTKDEVMEGANRRVEVVVTP
ncbi:OmpA family protein [Magnetospira thiophila]